MKTFLPPAIPTPTRISGRAFVLSFLLGVSALHGVAQEQPLPKVLPPKIPAVAPAQNTPALVWDTELREVEARPGDATASFTFWFTNASPTDITINSVRASCGCTTARVAPMPWRIVPGTNSPIEVTVDLRGKQGTIAKTVTVDTSAGAKTLRFKINIPTASPASATAFPVATKSDSHNGRR